MKIEISKSSFLNTSSNSNSKVVIEFKTKEEFENNEFLREYLCGGFNLEYSFDDCCGKNLSLYICHGKNFFVLSDFIEDPKGELLNFFKKNYKLFEIEKYG